MILDLIHTNDLHDNFPQKTLDAIRSKESLLFDSGDAIGGSNTVYRDYEPILDKMKGAGYRAMAMGNREFHYRRDVLKKRIQAAKFPILAANLFDLKKEISPESFLFFTADQSKIALFGLTAPQYPIYSRWEKYTGWRFLDPLDMVKNLVPQLRERGAEFVICLSHLGFERDRLMAQKCPGIGLILGGHSHTILTRPYQVENTVILHAGAYGRFVGHWKLRLEKDNDRLKLTSVDGELARHHDARPSYG